MRQKRKTGADLAEMGYAIVPGVLAPEEIGCLVSQLAQTELPSSFRRRGETYAIRNLLDAVPAIRRLAASPAIRGLVEPALGAQAFPVRGLLFDKTPQANWKVPWHQDLSIAVKEKRDLAGFGPWSIKAGVVHVQPPPAILEGMLAVRIHLDDCGDLNAPVRVIPGSHLRGRLGAREIRQASTAPAVSCTVGAGGVLLMRPLLLHASSAAQSPLHRRVIHLEFASGPLPGGLEWAIGCQRDAL